MHFLEFYIYEKYIDGFASKSHNSFFLETHPNKILLQHLAIIFDDDIQYNLLKIKLFCTVISLE